MENGDKITCYHCEKEFVFESKNIVNKTEDRDMKGYHYYLVVICPNCGRPVYIEY